MKVIILVTIVSALAECSLAGVINRYPEDGKKQELPADPPGFKVETRANEQEKEYKMEAAAFEQGQPQYKIETSAKEQGAPGFAQPPVIEDKDFASVNQFPGTCTQGALRLVGGSSRLQGRVEICNNNAWGTVCDDGFGTPDANVVCRQLGFSGTGATARCCAAFGQGTGSIFLDDVACRGSELTLLSCPSRPIGTHNCRHSEDVGVVCEAGPGCFQGDVRLVNGTNRNEGRVEFCNNGVWGTVCDDLWSTPDAQVVCRQLRLPTSGAVALSRATFGQGTGSIWLDNVNCAGTESRLADCRANPIGSHNCVHAEDAGVRCGGVGCIQGDVRLVGGTTSNEGRVEFCNNGVWGTVCDDLWSTPDAQVVCRQLGLPTSRVTALSRATFGPGSGSIWLDNVNCAGTEARLADCRANPIGTHNCVHAEDAGVRCGGTCTRGDVRLVGGTSNLEGRVEICNNNAWGTVCDDGFGTADANVVCRQLGFSRTGATARCCAAFGQGTGSIFLDDVACRGSELTLLSCPSRPIGTHNCRHSEDVGVVCRPTLATKQDVFAASPGFKVETKANEQQKQQKMEAAAIEQGQPQSKIEMSAKEQGAPGFASEMQDKQEMLG